MTPLEENPPVAPPPPPAQTQPAASAESELAPGTYPATLGMESSGYPKQAETLDEICVHLKHVKCHVECRQPLAVDIEVKVDKIGQEVSRTARGTRISGRGHSHKPYQIAIIAIDPCLQAVSIVVEPLARLPIP